jgi:hypothetical protein
MAFPVSMFSCWKNKDVFDDERVCVHVFDPKISIPEPLLKRYDKIPARAEQGSLFNIGIPELIICGTTSSFLNIFQYFWPITRKEFQKIHGMISVQFDSEINGKEDTEHFSRYLKDQMGNLRSEGNKSAIILTLNDYTKYWASDLIQTWRNVSVEEFVIFKDPTSAPYLCDYPSLQKGFKRPPK